MGLPKIPDWITFLPDWREILRKAWSVRLMALAVLLSACEAGLPQIGADTLPPGVFAMLSAVISLLALFTRLLAQKSMRDDGKT